MICTALTIDTTTSTTNSRTTTSRTIPPSTPVTPLLVLREHQGGRPGDPHHGDPLARLDHLVSVERPGRPLVVADPDAAGVPVHPGHHRRRPPDQRLRPR